ncbi:MAG: P1 family peptidase [Opitutales bacterium]|nr:P1 family peptidase [Opitutales bacterium]NRA26466.1 P1 family peptidase [Opitutales bacterium]
MTPLRPALLIFVSSVIFAETPRESGIDFPGNPGPHNAITDVNGVTVGHTQVIKDQDNGTPLARSGVTALLPRGTTHDPVFAGIHALNGNGEMTGAHWIKESGFLEGPIMITNTHSIGAVHEGTILWMRERAYHDGGLAALPAIAETWDGFLNDINGLHVRPQHAIEALDTASSGPVSQGNVGGGTGMVCFRFKGGIGSSSRVFEIEGTEYTLGVLVQANFGRRRDFTLRGIPVGKLLPEGRAPLPKRGAPAQTEPEGNSIIAIVATDVPLLPHQLERVAQRVSLGVGQTGGTGKNSSGDIFIAFSTANQGAWSDPGSSYHTLSAINNGSIDPVFDATIQATEEAIINALFAAETMTGRAGNTVFELPEDEVVELFEK